MSELTRMIDSLMDLVELNFTMKVVPESQIQETIVLRKEIDKKISQLEQRRTSYEEAKEIVSKTEAAIEERKKYYQSLHDAGCRCEWGCDICCHTPEDWRSKQGIYG